MSSAQPERSGAARLNIGQVLDRLRPEFPGLAISKIRYYEDKGLIKPERTAAGYRKFCETDVERLRYALVMQRDHYLPLRVIAEHLDAIDRGLEPPPIEGVRPSVPKVALAADGLPGPEEFTRRNSMRMTRKELIKVARITDEFLTTLEQYGLVRASTTGHYDTEDLVIADTARELDAFGIEPRHLRAFRAAADREVGLVEQVTAPVRRSRDAAAEARAADIAAQIAALTVRLHATLVKSSLPGR